MEERGTRSVEGPHNTRFKIEPLDTTIQQEGRGWCWAACVQAILKSRGIQYSQRDLARLVPRLAEQCCETRLPKRCDVGLAEQEITDLFRSVGLAGVERTGPLTAAALNTALRGKRPVAIAFKWGHMCLVYGRQNDKYLIYDPLGPASGAISLAGIRNYGQGKNTWRASWTGL
jgi:ABC-type bacteriocin/lantibiotic exporter with double-glycine peptidase domain